MHHAPSVGTEQIRAQRGVLPVANERQTDLFVSHRIALVPERKGKIDDLAGLQPHNTRWIEHQTPCHRLRDCIRTSLGS